MASFGSTDSLKAYFPKYEDFIGWFAYLFILRINSYSWSHTHPIHLSAYPNLSLLVVGFLI